MNANPICNERWTAESAYAAWYPRLVVNAHKLTLEKHLTWPSRGSQFMLLIKRGSDAANADLRSLRDSIGVRWVDMSENQRIRRAIFAADRAMRAHLQTVLPLA